MDPFMDFLVGETSIFGTIIQNWMLAAVFMFILWMLYLLIMGQFKEQRHN
jgi:hypothetical protein